MLFIAEGDKAHHSDSTHHPNTVVGEFGNTASEPKHLYDNIDELNAHRRPVIIFAHSSIAIPPSSICMQQCPAYAELPKIPQNLTTVPAMQTNQDTNTDVGRHN